MGTEHAEPDHGLELSPDQEAERAGWGESARSEPRWPASIAVATSIALFIILPDRLINYLGPRWLVPVLEGAIGLALLIVSPRRQSREVREIRIAAIALIALVNVANFISLAELISALIAPNAHSSQANGRSLILASAPIWLTNVIVFALWYWELDRGGPSARLRKDHREPDFLFPQMTIPQATHRDWSPSFLDYLYTSFTNATAFSPTDTMPLTSWAKSLMMAQSLASLLTVALVVSRAVNILN